ncbi:hypothetical protein ABFS82_12G112000 [Erythranthe guttata]
MGPFPSDKPQQLSDQSQSELRSDSSLNSRSSLSSQSSLRSVPSLTPPLEHYLYPHTSTTTAHAGGASAHHHYVATIKSHSSSVFSLSLAGKHLYSGDSNGEIHVRDAHSHSPSPPSSHNNNHQPVAECRSAVKSMAISGENLLFTAHHNHEIRVWKIDNSSAPNGPRRPPYKLIKTLPTMTDRCLGLFSSGGHVSVRRHKKSTWVRHVDAVSALALTADATLLYSASWDRTFKVWRTSDFKCLESVQNAHDDAINAVALSGDGFAYTGSGDKRIRVWKKNGGDKKRHSLVATLEKHRSAVNALALSADGAVLYSGACDRSIIVWERDGGAAHMAVVGALRGHTKAILCLAVVSDLLCSGSADRTVRIWRRESGNSNSGSGNSYSCLSVFEGHNNPVKCLTACLDINYVKSSDNSGTSYMVYSGCLDSEIKIWNLWVPIT